MVLGYERGVGWGVVAEGGGGDFVFGSVVVGGIAGVKEVEGVLSGTRDATPAASGVVVDHLDAAGEAADEVDIVTSPLREGGLVLVRGSRAGR